jgi:hypothetical protein
VEGARGCTDVDGGGPERPAHGEVLTEADGDGIDSLQGIAW